MADYNVAFKKPFTDWKKLMIGLAISVASSVVMVLGKYGGPGVIALLALVGMLIGLLLSGYYVRVSVLVFKNKNTMPEWNKWGDLFIQGLLVAIISFIYTLPILLLLLAFAGMTFLANIGTTKASFAGLGTGIIISLILGVLIGYVLPSAILGFIKKKKIIAAFDFKTVFKKAFNKRYFVAWLISLVYGILLTAVLGFVPYAGAPVASFITTITGITLLTEAYK